MIIKKYLVNLFPPSSSITENNRFETDDPQQHIRGPASWIGDQQAMFTWKQVKTGKSVISRGKENIQSILPAVINEGKELMSHNKLQFTSKLLHCISARLF